MTRIRLPRGLAYVGCFATLSLACFVTGCQDQAPTPPASPQPSTQPSAPAAKPAAAPVHVALHDGYVRLTEAVHPYARPAFEQGRLDPERTIDGLSLFFKQTPEQRRDRDALVKAQVDPKSPEFRRWLTPDTYAARFGASQDILDKATAWLQSQGLEVTRTSRLHDRVVFSAKVRDLEKAFQTEMHTYLVRGETHYAMATPPAYPPHLASSVLALYDSHDFYARPGASKALAHATQVSLPEYTLHMDAGADAGPDAMTQANLLAPSDWVTAYDVGPLYNPGIGGKTLDGTGVTIAIPGESPISTTDIAAFRSTFGLPPSTVTQTLVPGTGTPRTSASSAVTEATLDVEWAGAIATGATVNFYYTGNHNPDDAVFYIVEENLGWVTSESYGGCEYGMLPSDADITEENGTAANLMGITYMASSGDSGATDCIQDGISGLYVDMPSSYPGVTAVGGTQLAHPTWTDGGALVAPGIEEVWNELNDPYYAVYSGGGGISSAFARPAYQNSVATCQPVGSLPWAGDAGGMRQTPDIALPAAVMTPGIVIWCSQTLSSGFGGGPGTPECNPAGGSPTGMQIGGTSASSPTFASVVAILDEAVGQRLGNINPMLYALAAQNVTPSPFKDITTGSNEVICSGAGLPFGEPGPDSGLWDDAGCSSSGVYGYPATTGYDCASGLGSIDAFNLVSALIGVSKTSTALAVAPTLATEGGPVTLTATVDTVGTNAHTMTGAVTFTFESFTAVGGIDLSWELGSSPLTGATATSGTAALTTAIPPGLVKPNQFVDVIAVYGGDSSHLSSTSPKVGVGFEGINFSIAPSTTSIAVSGTASFTSTGGIAPIQWFIAFDSTSGRNDAGVRGNASIDPTTGALTAGPKDGFIQVAAIDADNAEATANVTVGSPTVAAPWSPDGGMGVDAGAVAPIFVDAGQPTDAAQSTDAAQPTDAAIKDAATAQDSASPTKDASTPEKDASTPVTTKDAGHTKSVDAAEDGGGSSGGGGGCDVSGDPGRSRTASLGAFACMALGLAALTRRKRARK